MHFIFMLLPRISSHLNASQETMSSFGTSGTGVAQAFSRKRNSETNGAAEIMVTQPRRFSRTWEGANYHPIIAKTIRKAPLMAAFITYRIYRTTPSQMRGAPSVAKCAPIFASSVNWRELRETGRCHRRAADRPMTKKKKSVSQLHHLTSRALLLCSQNEMAEWRDIRIISCSRDKENERQRARDEKQKNPTVQVKYLCMKLILYSHILQIYVKFQLHLKNSCGGLSKSKIVEFAMNVSAIAETFYTDTHTKARFYQRSLKS